MLAQAVAAVVVVVMVRLAVAVVVAMAVPVPMFHGISHRSRRGAVHSRGLHKGDTLSRHGGTGIRDEGDTPSVVLRRCELGGERVGVHARNTCILWKYIHT